MMPIRRRRRRRSSNASRGGSLRYGHDVHTVLLATNAVVIAALLGIITNVTHTVSKLRWIANV